MNKNRVKYKDYIIKARPWKLRDNKGWIPKAELEYHFGSGVTIIPLHSKKILSTKDEAVKYSIGMAKQWIDKKYY